MAVVVLSQDEFPSLHEVAHRKVVVEKVLDEKLEDPVVQFEGLLGVDEHPLYNLVKATGGRRGAKRVEGQVRRGSLGIEEMKSRRF